MNFKRIFLFLISSALMLSAFEGCTASETSTDSETKTEQTTYVETTSAPQETEAPDTGSEDTALPKDREYSVLFIGNSYTFYNSMPENIFQSICDAAGYNVKVESVTRGGYYLHQFASSADEYGSKVKDKLSEKDYDFIVIQEQSGNPAKNPNSFFEGARALIRKIRRYSEDTQIVFYETWGYKNGYHLLPTHGGDTAGMEMKNRAAYTAIAENLGADVALVGAAFLDVYQNSDVEVYDTDFSHPSKNGSVLAACTIFSTIFKCDVREVNFNAGISRSDLQIVREAAYVAAFEEHPVDNRYKIEIE